MGVSTAILVFIKTNTGGTDKVWFYNMEADGYTLDDATVEDNVDKDFIREKQLLKNILSDKKDIVDKL